ncbi:DUF6455 family protein [Pelagovum pacificum]|uniref:DUF6455 domain-containing protein n=1 Tax=Pelagovum pacificum TaxID=2588711 RepID=A0A5C5G9S2_9RHOB|nr:DUF6455 family protein [Pelagovum pacificum]QQA42435.1 hypothetical protein I8N54_16840 [Pelagovum pacificum]TNY31518.1 hypothetical protein FHY64_16030 [Pelagovum pacificum]
MSTSSPETAHPAHRENRAELRERLTRMHGMAANFGIPGEVLAISGVGAEAARVCANCGHQVACREVTAQETAPARCGFCPNAPTFEMLAATLR